MGKEHVRQEGHYDPLASREQLETNKVGGYYDPRGVSGAFEAVRVKLVCGRCGRHVGNIEDFENRPLIYSVQDARWRIGSFSSLRCPCLSDGVVLQISLDAFNEKLQQARHAGKTKTLKIGTKPAKFDT